LNEHWFFSFYINFSLNFYTTLIFYCFFFHNFFSTKKNVLKNNILFLIVRIIIKINSNFYMCWNFQLENDGFFDVLWWYELKRFFLKEKILSFWKNRKVIIELLDSLFILEVILKSYHIAIIWGIFNFSSQYGVIVIFLIFWNIKIRLPCTYFLTHRTGYSKGFFCSSDFLLLWIFVNSEFKKKNQNKEINFEFVYKQNLCIIVKSFELFK